MIDLLFVALFQAVAGAPEAPPAEQAAAATTTQETEAERQAREAEEAAEERRCRARELTGSRLRTVVTCRTRNGHQDEDTRAAMDMLQGPTGLNSN
jgi:hypothetical protein